METYPLDVLGAETEGMIGYMIEQELGNLLPFEVPFATLLTMVEVDRRRSRPSRTRPSSSGRSTTRPEAERIAAEKGWVFKQDGAKWRRVVPSPLPKRIFEMRPIKWLLEHGTIVICAGGGGIPTMYEPGADRKLVGVEASSTRICARSCWRASSTPTCSSWRPTPRRCSSIGARPTQKAIRTRQSPAALASTCFPAGSMGPKVEAACRFAESHRAQQPRSARWPTFRRSCAAKGNDRQQDFEV